jgi:hypothetical protein
MTEPEPVAGAEQVPTFEPVDFTVTEADTVKRQNDDSLWYRSLPFRGRP